MHNNPSLLYTPLTFSAQAPDVLRGAFGLGPLDALLAAFRLVALVLLFTALAVLACTDRMKINMKIY